MTEKKQHKDEGNEKKEDVAKNVTEHKDKKIEEKKEEKKQEEEKVKDVAIVRSFSSRISPKNSFAICDMIRGRNPDKAIQMLEEVIKHKRVVEMRNREIPHRKGKGISAGRYPELASKEFINLLKQLKANASVNGIENPVITLAKADIGSRPFKRGGRKAKRTSVYMEVRDKSKLTRKKK